MSIVAAQLESSSRSTAACFLPMPDRDLSRYPNLILTSVSRQAITFVVDTQPRQVPGGLVRAGAMLSGASMRIICEELPLL